MKNPELLFQIFTIVPKNPKIFQEKCFGEVQVYWSCKLATFLQMSFTIALHMSVFLNFKTYFSKNIQKEEYSWLLFLMHLFKTILQCIMINFYSPSYVQENYSRRWFIEKQWILSQMLSSSKGTIFLNEKFYNHIW